MTSDFCEQGVTTDITDTNTGVCESGQMHNYYSWTTTSGSTQTYSIWIRYRVPDNFAAWAASNPVTVNGRTSNATNGHVKLYIYNTSNAVETNANGLDIDGTASTWTATPVSSLGATYSPGSYMTIQITLDAVSSASVQVGEISLDYLSSN
jgi:hypothetical protein